MICPLETSPDITTNKTTASEWSRANSRRQSLRGRQGKGREKGQTRRLGGSNRAQADSHAGWMTSDRWVLAGAYRRAREGWEDCSCLKMPGSCQDPRGWQYTLRSPQIHPPRPRRCLLRIRLVHPAESLHLPPSLPRCLARALPVRRLLPRVPYKTHRPCPSSFIPYCVLSLVPPRPLASLARPSWDASSVLVRRLCSLSSHALPSLDP